MKIRFQVLLACALVLAIICMLAFNQKTRYPNSPPKSEEELPPAPPKMIEVPAPQSPAIMLPPPKSEQTPPRAPREPNPAPVAILAGKPYSFTTFPEVLARPEVVAAIKVYKALESRAVELGAKTRLSYDPPEQGNEEPLDAYNERLDAYHKTQHETAQTLREGKRGKGETAALFSGRNSATLAAAQAKQDLRSLIGEEAYPLYVQWEKAERIGSLLSNLLPEDIARQNAEFAANLWSQGYPPERIIESLPPIEQTIEGDIRQALVLTLSEKR